MFGELSRATQGEVLLLHPLLAGATGRAGGPGCVAPFGALCLVPCCGKSGRAGLHISLREFSGISAAPWQPPMAASCWVQAVSLKTLHFINVCDNGPDSLAAPRTLLLEGLRGHTLYRTIFPLFFTREFTRAAATANLTTTHFSQIPSGRLAEPSAGLGPCGPPFVCTCANT